MLTILKDFLEITCYIAFIILTILIVIYAKKTYSLEAEKRYDLLCKLNIQKEIPGGYGFDYGIEIYNSGNISAKSIELIVEGKKVTQIDFIQPRSSVLYPIGFVFQTLGGNIANGEYATLQKGKPLNVTLVVSGEKTEYALCTDILFDANENLTGTLNDVKEKLAQIKDELSKISGELSKIRNATRR